VSLLTELSAFFTDRRLCGDLDAGVEGEVVWIACDCGRAWPGAWTGPTMPVEPELARTGG
jgi:hypothetical protein